VLTRNSVSIKTAILWSGKERWFVRRNWWTTVRCQV